MRKLIHILLLLFILITVDSLLNAQNYRLIDPLRARTYAKTDTSDLDSVYYFIKVDSVKAIGTDSIFYFNQHMEFLGDAGCDYKNGYPSELGKKVIVLSDTDGTNIFFNSAGDSIFIKSKIKVGDWWHVYEWPNGTYVKATVINKLLRTVLPGIEDTVIRIQLNVFNMFGAGLTDTFPNQTKIDITENYGLIEFFDMNIFPLPGDSISMLLRGLDDPDQGKTDVDAETAFDFDLGYEFHYREEVSPDIASGGDKRISAWKYFVMNRIDYTDSVSFTMERIKFDTIYFGASPTSNITWDTISVTYKYSDYRFLDTLEYCLFQSDNYGYSDWVMDTAYKGIAHKYVYDWYNYNAVDDCINNPTGISQPEQLYGDGLGLMHYLDSADATNYYKLDMVFFHVGLLEWGTPYDFSALDEAIHDLAAEELICYPNPAHDIINCRLPALTDRCEILISSLDGKLIDRQFATPLSEEVRYNCGSILPGCYLMEIKTDDAVYYGKFIRQ